MNSEGRMSVSPPKSPARGQWVGSLYLDWNFDSGNLDRAQERAPEKIGELFMKNGQEPMTDLDGSGAFEYDLSLWIRADCQGKGWQRNYRTWFYFSVSGWVPGATARFRLENMNRQGKLMRMGFSPVYRFGWDGAWEKVPSDQVSYEQNKEQMKMEWLFPLPPSSPSSLLFFALSYPYSLTDLHSDLKLLDDSLYLPAPTSSERAADEIYYHRMVLCETALGNKLDVLTVSSHHGISDRPELLPSALPPSSPPPPLSFPGKPVVFISSRVHPGETGASFVMRGLTFFLCHSSSPEAKEARKKFVFKLVPILNPDGVSAGNYRCDLNGINLNRIYNRCDRKLFPTINAMKTLLLWYTAKRHVDAPTTSGSRNQSIRSRPSTKLSDVQEDFDSYPVIESRKGSSISGASQVTVIRTAESLARHQFKTPSKSGISKGSLPTLNKVGLTETKSLPPAPRKLHGSNSSISASISLVSRSTEASLARVKENLANRSVFGSATGSTTSGQSKKSANGSDRGVIFYLDLHGHVSKPGCFLYGNHFVEDWKQAENWVFARLMARRAAPYFDLGGCVFTEKNMRQKDRRGSAEGRGEQGKDGAGRVSVHAATGIVHCYTLECNYHGGRLIEGLKDDKTGEMFAFTPEIYYSIGEAIPLAILDYATSSVPPGLLPASPATQTPLSTPSKTPLSRSPNRNQPSGGSGSSGGFSIRNVRAWAKQAVQSQRSKAAVPKPPTAEGGVKRRKAKGPAEGQAKNGNSAPRKITRKSSSMKITASSRHFAFGSTIRKSPSNPTLTRQSRFSPKSSTKAILTRVVSSGRSQKKKKAAKTTSN